MTFAGTSTSHAGLALIDVSPETVAQWVASGDTVLLDVREDFEHAAERIAGAVPMPLSRLDPQAIRDRFGDARVVFQCAGGKRSAQAAARCCRNGERMFHLAGGIEAWKAAGHPIERPRTSGAIPIMRQVQITAGALVALGIALGVTVSPWFLALAAFVGCGLMVAGITGWCGMALILARMPWNRTPHTRKQS